MFRALSAGLLVTGCASLSEGGLHLEALREAPAPAGIVGFCERTPDACGGQAPARTRLGAPDPLALFHSLPAHGPVPAMVAPLQPSPAELTAERWAMLAGVNRAANSAVDPVSDETLYGMPDFWTLPERADGRASGDCEDLALEKRARLLAAGWPPEALSLVVAMGERGLHATLVAHTDRGDFLLDGEQDRPLPLEKTRYRWLLMQTGRDLLAWRSVRVARAPEARVAPEVRVL